MKFTKILKSNIPSLEQQEVAKPMQCYFYQECWQHIIEMFLEHLQLLLL